MRHSLTNTCVLTVCVALTLVAQLSCSHHDPLNENEGAQVAQLRNDNGNRNALARTSDHNANATANRNTTANANKPGGPANDTTVSAGPPSREEVEKHKTFYQQVAKEHGRTIGNGPDDAWLWVKIMYSLDYSIPEATINVDVVDGAVTLSGIVASQEQSKKAESLVRRIEGVKSIQNSLTIAQPK